MLIPFSSGRCAPTQRKRLIEPLVQERNGTLPGKASSLGVILRAIVLKEPMFGPWIRIDSDRPSRSLELLFHLCNRLRRLEGAILRNVAEGGGRTSAVGPSGVRGLKDHEGGGL